MTAVSSAARISAGLVALCAAAALVLQYMLLRDSFAAVGQGALAALWRFLGFAGRRTARLKFA